ncbi:TRP47 family tandem repeat effector [Ehrlichia ruminantium]|uniref:TRP47 family tandem repeat effector n=1 Tax=Ehrlichia ruminantium TaxID=779 RepID=A0AAE6UKG0_EHRRU|nr:TRP47 family tandem repeat effector [Ehrlichia ruminantium]QGR03118.1 TRP47 family tandem repeat effector [Ehrlichia ruminantium]QGR04043.1 TRP47 family tandem repeat effector [Ehrlichia ruminantium]
MIHSTSEDCMLHLTTKIDNVDFGSDLSVYGNDQFSVSSGGLRMDVGYHKHDHGHEHEHEHEHDHDHGAYHVMFIDNNNGHILSDFHGVVGKHIMLDVLNHSLQASFIVNLMEPFSPFLHKENSHFALNVHPVGEDCYNYHNDGNHEGHTHIDQVNIGAAVQNVLGSNTAVEATTPQTPPVESSRSTQDVTRPNTAVEATTPQTPSVRSDGEPATQNVPRSGTIVETTESQAHSVESSGSTQDVSRSDAAVEATTPQNPSVESTSRFGNNQFTFGHRDANEKVFANL